MKKEIKCPVCRSKEFFIKDPDDAYECYEFSVTNGQLAFDPEVDQQSIPDFVDQTEVFCQICSWHGSWSNLEKNK